MGIGVPLPAALIAFGGFLVLHAVIGTWGIKREHWTLIAIYLITLVMLLVAQIGAGMVAVRFEDNVKEQMFQGWKDSNDAVKVRIWLPPLSFGAGITPLCWV